MAASDANVFPKKNTAYRLYYAMRLNTGVLAEMWDTPTVTVSKDGGNYASSTNTPTEIQTSGTGYIDLTATEMNAENVTVICEVANTDAIPTVVTIYTGGSLEVTAEIDLSDYGDTENITDGVRAQTAYIARYLKNKHTLNRTTGEHKLFKDDATTEMVSGTDTFLSGVTTIGEKS